jgi:hypothetical protein
MVATRQATGRQATGRQATRQATSRHAIRPDMRPVAPSLAPLRAAVALALVAAVVIVIGGYGFGWRWTGLSDRVTLWDWLQALALPIALAAAPLLWRHRRRMTHRHHAAGALGVTAFAVLALCGYLVPWSWTGFTGNTLWDWLELALLPLAVATASLWAEAAPATRRAILSALVVVFVLLALCGYLVPWHWTGFTGNTAWDWFKLLLLPVLVPTVLVPAVTAVVDARFADR